MKKLKTGEFYGAHYHRREFDNLLVTDTEYTHPKVDWHYHENPYFTYLLQGKLFESNKKESYYLEPGSLLFHNWQDAHYNIKPPDFTRGFHIELNDKWFSNYDIKTTDIEGSVNIQNPLTKSLMNKLFVESKISNTYSNLSIDALMVDIFGTIQKDKGNTLKAPTWVMTLKELILEEEVDYSLKSLGITLGIHPAHLSREFRRYFGTSLGSYIRLLKLNKAFHMLTSGKFSMTEICYTCGFYDQSHFISNFKHIYNATPTKLLRDIS